MVRETVRTATVSRKYQIGTGNTNLFKINGGNMESVIILCEKREIQGPYDKMIKIIQGRVDSDGGQPNE